MQTEISAAIASVKTLMEMGEALINARDSHKAATIKDDLLKKIGELRAQLAEVSSAIVEKNGTIEALRKTVSELQAQQAEKARYALAKVGTVGEFYAYRLRPRTELTERVDEPAHFVCQPCFESGKKGVLVGNGEGYFACPLCGKGAHTEPTSGLVQTAGRRRTEWDDF